MSLIERFTRDEASKYVWAVVALAAAIGLVYAISGGGRAEEDERAASQGRVVRYVEKVLESQLDSRDLAAPITGSLGESLDGAVRRSILADERVSRVRIWSTEGALLFSTDPSDHRGSDEVLNDRVLRDASREGPLTRSDFSDGGGADDPERTLLRTYVPLGTAAVVEIDQTDEGTIAPVRTEWFSYRLLAGGLLLLFFVMTAISLREPIERINVGVPFGSSSVPRGFSLIDDDRLAAVEEVYRLASERVGRLQEKLDESEEARRRLESYIQQQLSRVGPSAPQPAAASESETPAPAAPGPEPTVVRVPESEVVVAAPLDDPRAGAPAGPLARASRAQKLPPTTSRKERPSVERPKRSPKKLKSRPKERTDAPAEVATPPDPTEPERREPAVAATRAPAPAAAEEPTRKQDMEMKSGHGGTHTWHPLCEVFGCEHAEGSEGEGGVETSRPGPMRSPSPAASSSASAPAPAKAPAPARVKAPRPASNGVRAPTPKRAAAPISRESEIDDAKEHASALETFIRLTESDRQHHDTAAVDPGAVRAALVRTAARKKPGWDKLPPQEGPREGLPGGRQTGRE